MQKPLLIPIKKTIYITNVTVNQVSLEAGGIVSLFTVNGDSKECFTLVKTSLYNKRNDRKAL